MKTLLLALLTLTPQLYGAIGCTLSNPAEDLKYLYPEMTSFKEELNEFPRLKGGSELFKGLKARLGSNLDSIYETYETPYTVYVVFKGAAKIGIVHGVNVPGKGGVIQVFLSMDPATAQIPVIGLSANAMSSDIERGLEAGFFRYLTKPIRVDEFLRTLNLALKFAQSMQTRTPAKESV